MSKYDALILAGGESPWLEPLVGTQYRCLAKINDRYCLDYILDALQQCGFIRRIAIVAAPGAIDQLQAIVPPNITVCAAAEKLPATAYAGIQALGADCSEMILGICDDIPTISADALKDFIEKCEANSGQDVYYPLISRQTCEAQFPEAQRTYGKLREGEFTGGNMMFIAREAILRGQAVGKQIYELRKSPYKLSRWVGMELYFQGSSPPFGYS